MEGETPGDPFVSQLIGWTTNDLIGHDKHDWVVEVDSSLPSSLPASSRLPEVRCDHFSYFKGAGRRLFPKVIAYLGQQLFPKKP